MYAWKSAENFAHFYHKNCTIHYTYKVKVLHLLCLLKTDQREKKNIFGGLRLAKSFFSLFFFFFFFCNVRACKVRSNVGIMDTLWTCIELFSFFFGQIKAYLIRAECRLPQWLLSKNYAFPLFFSIFFLYFFSIYFSTSRCSLSKPSFYFVRICICTIHTSIDRMSNKFFTFCVIHLMRIVNVYRVSPQLRTRINTCKYPF